MGGLCSLGARKHFGGATPLENETIGETLRLKPQYKGRQRRPVTTITASFTSPHQQTNLI